MSIQNHQIVLEFIQDHALDTNIKAIEDANPTCLLCSRPTGYIGIYEDDTLGDAGNFQFYGLCLRHAPHIRNLMARIQATIEAMPPVIGEPIGTIVEEKRFLPFEKSDELVVPTPEQEAALAELAAQAQELKMGYELDPGPYDPQTKDDTNVGSQ